MSSLIDEFEGVFDSTDADFILAIQLQMQAEDADDQDVIDTKQSIPAPQKSLSDPEWELVDPCPDVHAMFVEFDRLYFWSRLGSCRLEWSKRMTICAGLFYLREGGVIRLSEPLLKYRPRKDLVDTLLHEMIHAYLYITRNFKDRGSHGDEFKSHMDRINRQANTHITVYHSFHDEVRNARQHVWRCNGICRTFPPFYGYVKRSMNRAPSKNDLWWAQHQAKCSGTFEKISEPEKKPKKQTSDRATKSNNSTLDSFVRPSSSKQVVQKPVLTSPRPKKEARSPKKTDKMLQQIENFFPKKRKTEDTRPMNPPTKTELICLDDDCDDEVVSRKLVKKEPDDRDVIVVANSDKRVECPVCFERISSDLINLHVESHF